MSDLALVSLEDLVAAIEARTAQHIIVIEGLPGSQRSQLWAHIKSGPDGARLLEEAADGLNKAYDEGEVEE